MIRLVARLGLAALCAAMSVPATGLLAAAEPIPGTTCNLFPADSVFNTDISTLPVNSQSATWMSNMTQNANLHPDLGTFAQWYGMPINVAPPPTTSVTPTFLYDSESDHPAEGYPIDQNTFIEGGPSAPSGSDRHALVVNKNLCKLYEIYNLQNFTNGQTPQAGSGAVWDLNSDAMRPDGWTSADAAGLPMTPLVLRPDEILAGSITHAIRFTTHCTNGYIWPGSHNAGLCSTGFPPMGARFRLKPGFDLTSYSANTQVVLRAFQHYGLILADNGSDWFFGGTTDDWWGTAAGSTVVSDLKTIPASQFDAVDESSLQVAAGSYKAAGGLPQTWTSLGGTLTSGPDASSWGATRADAFVRGTDNGLYHNYWNGAVWSGYEGLGGVLTSDPGAVSWGPNRIDVFARGTDNGMYHRWWDGAHWYGWEAQRGVLSSGPDVASWGAGRLDVFVRGTDNALWHKWWDGSRWNGWESLGGSLASDPTAVSWGPNRVDVFAKATDNTLIHKWWDGTRWNGWESLGGSLTSAPDAASCSSGHLDVFALGASSELYRIAFNGTVWGTWTNLNSTWTSGPGAVCLQRTNTILLLERGTDAALWHTSAAGT